MISKIFVLLGTICHLSFQAWAEPILGTSYSSQTGTRNEGTSVAYFDNDDYVIYTSVNFGDPDTTKGILLNYSKGNHNGKVEIRLGAGTTGPLIAEFSPANTGGWRSYITAHIGIDDVDGIHDVTFVGKDNSGVLNLGWFELSDFADRADIYSRINGYEYSNQFGTVIESSNKNVGYYDNGDFITYSKINFGTPGTTDGIRLRYAKANEGGTVEVRLGGHTGPLIAEFAPIPTNGWHNYMDAYLGIKGVDGIHDVTFVGKGAHGVLNLKWFELSDRSSLNPHVDATAFSTQSGLRTDGTYLTYFDSNDFVTYSNLNFGTGGATRSLRVSYAKGNSGGKVEVRVNGPDGTIIGEFSPQHTGGWSTSVTADIAIDDVDGVNDLTFVGRDAGGVWNLEWVELL